MGVGDSAFVKGSNVACGVSHNSTIGNAMTCFKRRGENTQVGSYAVQLGDNYAALMRVTSRTATPSRSTSRSSRRTDARRRHPFLS